MVDQAIEAELKYKIPAQSVVVDEAQWDNLIKMQVYLKNIKGTSRSRRSSTIVCRKAAKSA